MDEQIELNKSKKKSIKSDESKKKSNLDDFIEKIDNLVKDNQLELVLKYNYISSGSYKDTDNNTIVQILKNLNLIYTNISTIDDEMKKINTVHSEEDLEKLKDEIINLYNQANSEILDVSKINNSIRDIKKKLAGGNHSIIPYQNIEEILIDSDTNVNKIINLEKIINKLSHKLLNSEDLIMFNRLQEKINDYNNKKNDADSTVQSFFEIIYGNLTMKTKTFQFVNKYNTIIEKLKSIKEKLEIKKDSKNDDLFKRVLDNVNSLNLLSDKIYIALGNDKFSTLTNNLNKLTSELKNIDEDSNNNIDSENIVKIDSILKSLLYKYGDGNKPLPSEEREPNHGLSIDDKEVDDLITKLTSYLDNKFLDSVESIKVSQQVSKKVKTFMQKVYDFDDTKKSKLKEVYDKLNEDQIDEFKKKLNNGSKMYDENYIYYLLYDSISKYNFYLIHQFELYVINKKDISIQNVQNVQTYLNNFTYKGQLKELQDSYKKDMSSHDNSEMFSKIYYYLYNKFKNEIVPDTSKFFTDHDDLNTFLTPIIPKVIKKINS